MRHSTAALRDSFDLIGAGAFAIALEDECVDVGDFFDLLGRRFALTMTGAHLDADQHRLAVRVGRLHRRGELEAVRGKHAVVVVAGDDQRRRVIRSGLDVVQRRVRIHRLELIGVVDRAVVRLPCLADREVAKAQHVEHADLRNRGGEQSPGAAIRWPRRAGRRSRPPRIARFCAGVYFSLIRYSAPATKSSNTFCLCSFMPASCHSRPYSPPPRRFATAYTPPRSSQAINDGENAGCSETLKPP